MAGAASTIRQLDDTTAATGPADRTNATRGIHSLLVAAWASTSRTKPNATAVVTRSAHMTPTRAENASSAYARIAGARAGVLAEVMVVAAAATQKVCSVEGMAERAAARA
jgi:hypothetical protein